MTRLATCLALATLVMASGASPLGADEGTWLERLLFNARERTVRGLEALRGTSNPDPSAPAAPTSPAGAPAPGAPAAPAPPGDGPAPNADQAIDPLDSALRLRGADDPVAQFNAGTARLAAQRADAVPMLEAASQAADARLSADASYNLGNAHLGQSNFQGAIDAFKGALRQDPANLAAKHNLELAQKLLEQQQQQQQEQQQNQDQQNQDQQDQENQDQQNQDQEGDEEQDQDQQNQDQQDQENQDQQDQQNQDQQDQQNQDQQNQDQQQGDEEQQQQQQQQERPLPQFEDLPDMTAEEAAAILEAVENLEREARRQEALEAAAQAQASGKKDW